MKTVFTDEIEPSNGWGVHWNFLRDGLKKVSL